ncbi:CHAD domain protein [Meiothermus luteus]|uniref:CHAD domain protein n=1 Tax=Meiothermus luteus TaxID=2026184 RepID=A0A399ESZ8_9DEIN|nr:CHAD domain-containing protein [Meiothermus luteus]RIH86636.1 CHAD domain protein [Meiothermus luteus]RMH58120.1 MAG: CHAD domain-containing protein [Deinococcota bacterium]
MRSVPLNPWLQHLRQHLPIARAGQDPEGVHQVRVAGRRLRVWLRLAGMRTLDDDLAWLVRSAGEVRDLEVLLQTEFPQAFREWAQSRLNTAREKLLPVLESKRLEGLLQALSLLPPLGIADAEPRLGRFFAQVERRAALWSQEERFDVLHALRRALRRLRYALEWLGQESRAVKSLQESFGQVGDLHLTLVYLRQFASQGGHLPSGYLRKKEMDLAKALQEAKSHWRKGIGELRS